jgi:hypothetical protein
VESPFNGVYVFFGTFSLIIPYQSIFARSVKTYLIYKHMTCFNIFHAISKSHYVLSSIILQLKLVMVANTSVLNYICSGGGLFSSLFCLTDLCLSFQHVDFSCSLISLSLRNHPISWVLKMPDFVSLTPPHPPPLMPAWSLPIGPASISALLCPDWPFPSDFPSCHPI